MRPIPGPSASTASRLIYEADPTQFDYVHGRSAQEVLRQGWTKETGLYSHRIAHCLTSGGEVAGLEIGCDAEQLEDRHRETRASLDLGARSRFDAFWMLLPRVPPGVYYLSFISVAELYRGQGLGTRLLTDAIRRARKQRCWGIQLDAVDGADCIRLYRRLGFRPVCRTTHTDLPHFEENLRLHLDLGA